MAAGRAQLTPPQHPQEDRAFQNTGPSHRPTRKRSLLVLAGFVGLCLLTALAAGAITAGSVHTWFRTLARPPGTPPDAVFGPVWTVLYVLMAVSAWRIWLGTDRAPQRVFRALRLWGWQLLFNALWTPAFFGVRSLAGAVAVMALLLVFLLLTIAAFARLDRLAAALLLPYLAWVAYAAYLSVGFWMLNAA